VFRDPTRITSGQRRFGTQIRAWKVRRVPLKLLIGLGPAGQQVAAITITHTVKSGRKTAAFARQEPALEVHLPETAFGAACGTAQPHPRLSAIGGDIPVCVARRTQPVRRMNFSPPSAAGAAGTSMPCLTSKTLCGSFLGPQVRCSLRSAKISPFTALSVRCGNWSRTMTADGYPFKPSAVCAPNVYSRCLAAGCQTARTVRSR